MKNRKKDVRRISFLYTQMYFRIPCEKMICLETQSFKLNRIILLTIGLWPLQRSKLIDFQLTLFFGIVVTFILFQFTSFLTFECTTDFVIRIISSTFFFIGLAIKYNSFYVNINIIKHSIKQLQCVCDGLKNEDETAIIKKYSVRAKCYTIVITAFGMCSIIVVLFLQIWSHVRHVILFRNESHSRPPTYFTTEYFIDQNKYFYLIMLHGHVASCIGSFAMIGTGTMLISYFQHICGMFSVASFRIEQAMTTNMLSGITQENQIMIYKNMIYAVDIHRKAMEFAKFLISNLEGSYVLLILAGMVCLISSLVRIVSSLGDIEQLIIPIIYITVNYVYLFLSNYTGQEIIEHNNHVYNTIYNVQWYAAPLRVQKMILFLLQRSTKAFNLNLGGLFIVSMESAASLTSTSISYFTVLYSMRKN